MKKLYLSAILLFVSSGSFAEDPQGISVYELAKLANKAGVEKSLTEIESSEYFNPDDRTLLVADLLESELTGETASKRWYVSRWDPERSGYSIELPNDHYLLTYPRTDPNFPKTECDNMASVGAYIYSLGESRFVRETWSCGSAGCGYGFEFLEQKETDAENLCDG